MDSRSKKKFFNDFRDALIGGIFFRENMSSVFHLSRCGKLSQTKTNDDGWSKSKSQASQ